MTEAPGTPSPAPDPASSGSAEGAPPAPAAKGRRPRKWWRRLAWCALGFIAVLVVIRLTIPFTLPWVLSKLAAKYNLSLTYERMDRSFSGGYAEIWHLTIAPAEGGEPFAHFEYVEVDLVVSSLLFGKIEFRRLEVDGADLLSDRDEDGRLRLFRRMGIDTQKPAEPGPAAKPAAVEEKPKEVDLRSPVVIDALRFEYVKWRIRDRSVSPPLDTTFTVNLRLSDLGSEVRPARFELYVASPHVLDKLAVEGFASTAKESLSVTFDATARGLHLAPLAGYLAPFGLRPAADDISFHSHGKVTAKASAEPGAVEVALRVEDAAVVTDGETALALEEIALDAPAVGLHSAHVKELRIAGARALTRITSAGHPRVAGIEVAGGAAPERRPAPDPAPPPAPVSAPAARTGEARPGPAPTPYRLRIDRLAFDDSSAMLHDESFVPAVSLLVHATEVAVKDLVKDPNQPEAAASITARLDAPGIFDSLRIDGRAVPFARRKTVELNLAADGIRFSSLAPYLGRAGAEPRLDGGWLEGTIEVAVEPGEDGDIDADLQIGPARFSDAETLLDFGGLNVCGIRVKPASNAISIDDIAISGPRIAARRDAAGNVDVLGIRIRPAVHALASAAPPAPVEPRPEEPTAQASPASYREEVAPESHTPSPSPFRLEIGRFRWGGIGATFADDAVAPAARIALEDVGVAIDDLSIDLDPDAPATPARFRASLAAPGIVESVLVTGSLQPRPSSAWLNAEVAGRGISLSALAPYLSAAGLEPAVKDGDARCSIGVDLSTLAGLLDAGLVVEDVRYGEGEAEFAGLDALRVKEIEAGGSGGLRVASVEVERPRAGAFRDSTGAVHFAGIRLPLPPADATSPAEAPSAPPPVASRRGERTLDPAPSSAKEAGASFRLDKLRIREARLAWADQALAEPLSAAFTAAMDLDRFAPGSKEPASFRIRAASDGTLDEASAEGTLAIEAGGAAAAVDVRARGLRAGPFAAYLPPGVRVGLKDGRFDGKLEAGSSRLPDGGLSAHLVVSGVDYRDGEESPSLLKLGALKLIAPRIDPAGGQIDIDEVSVAGFEMGVVLPEPGIAETLGIVVCPREGKATDPAMAATPAPTGPAAAAAPPPAATTPGAAAPGAPASEATPATQVARAAPAPRRTQVLRPKPPRVTLRKLDLGLDRFSVLNGPPGGAMPLVLEDVRLSNQNAIDILGEQPDEKPPILLSLTGKLTPVVDSFGAGISLQAITSQPKLEIDFKADGVKGKDLAALLPPLADKIDGAGLTDGRLAGRFETTFRPERGSALDPGVARSFGIETILKETSFRNGADGPVLLGLDELRVDVARVDSTTGAVHVKEIEVQKPVAAVRRVEEGIEVAGIVVKLPKAPAEGDAPAGEQGKDTKPAPAAETPAAREPAAEPAMASGAAPERPEMRIDKLLVNGLDLRADDLTCDPPFHFWLDDLEMEVRNISNRLLSDPKPLRFHVATRSGKVPIPVPLEANAIAGAIADASALMSGAAVDTEQKLEDGPVFEDYLIKGKLSLYPKLGGWAETQVAGLNLAAFRGIAGSLGIALQGGTVDSRSVVRFPGDGSLTKETRLKLTDLDVSEPSDGPIFRYLKLPAPLGAVIFAIRDEEGVIKVPIDLTVPREGVTAGAITGAILGTVGQVIGRAFLNTPFRMASTVTAFLPGEEEVVPKPEEPIVLEFAGGDPEFPAGESAKLATLMERISDGDRLRVELRHEFGGKDLARAEERANPPLEDCLEIAARLRREKARGLVLREEATARARNAILSGLWRESASATERLRELDVEIQTADQGLQNLYDRTRPGAERQAPRRTRDAAVAIARARLAAVQAALAPASGERAGEIIRSSRPIVPETAQGETGKVLVIVTPER